MRFCSVASRRGRGVIRSSCGVAALCLPHHSPVVSFASRLSVSCGVSLFVLHALRAGAAWRACSSHRGLIVLVWRGRSWCRGVLLCLPVSSDLFFSCHRSGRSFSSRRGVSSCRLVERGGLGFSFYPGGEQMGCGSCLAVSTAVPACLGAVGGWGNDVLVIGVPACSLSSYGCGACAPCGISHLAHHRLLLVLRWLSLLLRAANSI